MCTQSLASAGSFEASRTPSADTIVARWLQPAVPAGCNQRATIYRRIDVETRAGQQDQIPLRFGLSGRVGGKERFETWIVVDDHVHAVIGERRKLRSIEDAVGRHDRRALVAARRAGGLQPARDDLSADRRRNASGSTGPDTAPLWLERARWRQGTL